MEHSEVIGFFDRAAQTWDAHISRSDKVIGQILDRGGITEGVRVLDVACSTGILFSDYLERGAAKVVGVDISPEMARIAAEKFSDRRVEVICADVQELEFEQKFDCVMVYNAFPHFPEPEKLIAHLASQLKPGGRLTVAHGMSRMAVEACHRGKAKHISIGLMEEQELARLMEKWIAVDTVVSDQEKYMVSGRARG